MSVSVSVYVRVQVGSDELVQTLDVLIESKCVCVRERETECVIHHLCCDLMYFDFLRFRYKRCVLQCVAACCSSLQCVAVCCVVVCCSVLQCMTERVLYPLL